MSAKEASVTEAIGEALTADQAMQTANERRHTAQLIGATLIVLLVAVVAIALFGLKALGMVGLLLTLVVFVILLAFTAAR